MRRWVRKPSYFAFFSPMGEGRNLISGDQIPYFEPLSPGMPPEPWEQLKIGPSPPSFFAPFCVGGKGCQGKTTAKKGKRDYPQSTLTLLDRLREQIGKIPFSFVSSWRREGKKKMAESPDQALQKKRFPASVFHLRASYCHEALFFFLFFTERNLWTELGPRFLPSLCVGPLKKSIFKGFPIIFLWQYFFAKSLSCSTEHTVLWGENSSATDRISKDDIYFSSSQVAPQVLLHDGAQPLPARHPEVRNADLVM